jgi:Tol biopolymer transport system component
MNSDGSGQRRLTFNSASDWEPSLSPGGTTIHFQSTRDHIDTEIYRMTSDGSGLRRLTFNIIVDAEPG